MSAPERVAAEKAAAEHRLTRDEIFDVLSSRRRRNVLHALNHGDGSTTVGDLSRRLAAWENDHADEGDVTAKERKRVYTALRQTHLPKLQEVGVVDYDPDRGTVDLSPYAADLRPYLREPANRSWVRYYAFVAVAGLLLAVASAGREPLAAPLDGPVLTAAVSLTVLGVAAAHYWRTRPDHLDHGAILADTVPVLGEEATNGSEEE